MKVIVPMAGQPMIHQEVGRHGVKVAFTHGDHAFGVGRYHRADNFWQGTLERLHQVAPTDRGDRGDLRADLEAVVRKVDVVRRFALPDGQDHINGFGEHLVAVLVKDAQRFSIRGQGTRADAENESTLGQVVEHGRLRGQQRGVRVR